MTDKITSPIVSAATTAFLKRTELIWGKPIDSILEKLHDGLHAYLERLQEKFIYTKTFLHRDPIYFYKIYHHLKVDFKSGPRRTLLYSDFFGEDQCLGIIGVAGSGKSTLMRHLFLNVIDKGSNEVPLFIELRRIAPGCSIMDFISKGLLGDGIIITEGAMQKMLTEGKLMLFLDGFDEINPDSYSLIVQTLDDLVLRYPKVKMVITGRPGSKVDNLRHFKCGKITKLSQQDIKKFVAMQGLGIELESRITQIIESIQKERKKHLLEYLSNPLLLSLFILTCTTTKQLPDRKSAFYKRVIDTLFVEHDSVSKPDYDRRLRSGLGQANLERILQRFSAVSFFNSKFEFDKTYISSIFTQIFEKTPDLKSDPDLITRDFVVSVALWMEDAGEYSFSHRSIQEYFTAEFISTLDAEKKQEVYKRLTAKLAAGQLTEIENFIGLCLETDEQTCIKNLLLPTIDNMRRILNGRSDEAIAADLICGYYSKIVIFPQSIHPTKSKESPGFNRLSWIPLKSSSIISASLVFPSLIQGSMFAFVSDGIIEKLASHFRDTGAMGQTNLASPKGPTATKIEVMDIEKYMTPEKLVEIITGSSTVKNVVSSMRREFNDEDTNGKRG